MSKTPAPETKTTHIHMLMAPSEVTSIDDWGFANRIRTRAEAIRKLCAIGLVADGMSDDLVANADAISALSEDLFNLSQMFDDEPNRYLLDYTVRLSQKMVDLAEISDALFTASVDLSLKEEADKYAERTNFILKRAKAELAKHKNEIKELTKEMRPFSFRTTPHPTIELLKNELQEIHNSIKSGSYKKSQQNITKLYDAIIDIKFYLDHEERFIAGDYPPFDDGDLGKP